MTGARRRTRPMIWAASSASRGGRNRRASARAAEQLGQQRVVHVGPPRQPGRSSRRRPGRPPTPRRPASPNRPGWAPPRSGAAGRRAPRPGRGAASRASAITGLGRAEQGGLPGGGWPAGPACRPVGGRGPWSGRPVVGPPRPVALRPVPSRARSRASVRAASWQRSTRHPGAQQGRVDRGRVSPDPAHMFVTWPGALVLRHRRREIVDQGGRGVAAAVLGEFLQEGRAPGPGSYRNPHASDSPPSRRQSGAAGREFPGVWSRPGPWAGRAGPRRLHPQPEGCPWCPPTGPENLAGVTAACNRPDLSDG